MIVKLRLTTSKPSPLPTNSACAPFRPIVTVALARYSQTGQSEQACTELSTAIEMYRDMEMTFWLPETEAALATAEGR